MAAPLSQLASAWSVRNCWPLHHRQSKRGEAVRGQRDQQGERAVAVAASPTALCLFLLFLLTSRYLSSKVN